jgi:hypothetical protein
LGAEATAETRPVKSGFRPCGNVRAMARRTLDTTEFTADEVVAPLEAVRQT